MFDIRTKGKYYIALAVLQILLLVYGYSEYTELRRLANEVISQSKLQAQIKDIIPIISTNVELSVNSAFSYIYSGQEDQLERNKKSVADLKKATSERIDIPATYLPSWQDATKDLSSLLDLQQEALTEYTTGSFDNAANLLFAPEYKKLNQTVAAKFARLNTDINNHFDKVIMATKVDYDSTKDSFHLIIWFNILLYVVAVGIDYWGFRKNKKILTFWKDISQILPHLAYEIDLTGNRIVSFHGNSEKITATITEDNLYDILDYIHPLDLEKFKSTFNFSKLAKQPQYIAELVYRLRQGEDYIWVKHCISIICQDGEPKKVIGIIFDVDIFVKNNGQETVSKDKLTQFYNRLNFDEQYEKLYDRALRNKTWLSIMLINIDNFKKYNKIYGIKAGDEALSEVAAEILLTLNEKVHVPIRYGGEQLLIIMPLTTADEANVLAEKVRYNVQKLAIPHEDNNGLQYLTVSVGVGSIIPESEKVSPKHFIKLVDDALYIAKHTGKNKVVSMYDYLNSQADFIKQNSPIITGSLVEHTSLLSAFWAIAYKALSITNNRQAIDFIISETRRLLNVSRIVLWVYDGNGHMVCDTYESVAGGFMEITEQMRGKPVPDFFLTEEMFDQQGMVVSLDIDSLPDARLRDFLRENDVKAFLAVKLLVDGAFNGLIVMEDCVSTRIWQRDESHCFSLASQIITVLINKDMSDQSEQLTLSALKNITDNLQHFIYVADVKTHRILFANKTLENVFGNNIVGNICYEQFLKGSKPCEFCNMLDNNSTEVNEIYEQHLGQYYRVHRSMIYWKPDCPAYLVVATDISYLKNQQLLLEQKLDEDSITGLRNKRAANRELDNYVKKGYSFVCALLDIREFGFFNQKFGNAAGDELLLQIASFLKTLQGSNAFRLESDTFLILTEATYFEEVLLPDIVARFAKEWKLQDITYECEIDIAYIKYPSMLVSPSQLLRMVGLALNKAKEDSILNIIEYDDKLHKEFSRELQVKDIIEQALEEDGFEVYYQPIFDVKHGNYQKAEALLRLRDKEGNFIAPPEFISIAEKRGYIYKIGLMVLSKVCQFLQEHPTMMCIYVNISPLQLMHNSFVDDVKAVLRQYNIKAGSIGFEITENEFISSFARTNRIVQELNRVGIIFALDDFGSGYSSISYLDKIPVHVIKIDRSLIQDVLLQEKKQRLIKMIIDMAHQFSMSIVAEGVEEEAVVPLLSGLGCDAIQGFYFSRPLSQDDFIKNFVEKMPQ